MLHHSKNIHPERAKCGVRLPEAGDQIQTRGKGNLQKGNSSVSGMGDKSNCSSVTQETDTWGLSSLRAHAAAPFLSLMTEWVGSKPHPNSYLYLACPAFSSMYRFHVSWEHSFHPQWKCSHWIWCWDLKVDYVELKNKVRRHQLYQLLLLAVQLCQVLLWAEPCISQDSLMTFPTSYLCGGFCKLSGKLKSLYAPENLLGGELFPNRDKFAFSLHNKICASYSIF